MAPSLGTSLRVGREQRGLSLFDVAHQTRIPVQRLQYLEEDNFAAFGSLTYARSFVRIYSQFLGVDATKLLEKLPQGRLGGPAEYRHLVDTPEPWVAKSSHARQPKIGVSPVHAGLTIFVLLFACVSIWGDHIAHNLTAPTAMDPAPALNPLVGHEETYPDSKSLSIRTATSESNGQNVIKAIPAGPQDVEMLLSKRAGKIRPSRVE